MDIDKFRSDLLAIQFVISPSDDIDLLHEQYMSDLSGLQDIHAPVKTKQPIKPAPSWITDEYRTAKCMGRRYEYVSRRDESPENCTRLQQQTNRCNHILNKNKGGFYHELVSKNCGDGKKLWKALNRILKMPLSSHPLMMKNISQFSVPFKVLLRVKSSSSLRKPLQKLALLIHAPHIS